MSVVVAADIERARVAIRDVARRTPVLESEALSERCGARVLLKAENLQRTGSFKLRGALNKLASLGADCERGVVAGSAGNHAWALADAARARGVPCEVFMPAQAPLAKIEGCAALGAVVRLVGDSLEDCFAAATARAQEGGLAFVHPFDDPDVVAGQGTIGLELLEDVEDLAKVVVPVGGGGLASGIAIAVKSARPGVEVVGVQAEACAPFADSLRRGEPVAVSSALTIADGIAVKRPGELTLGLVARWLDDVRRGRRGRDRRGDGAADGAQQARGRGRRRRRRGSAAGGPGRARARAGPRWSCSPVATSTPGCSPRSTRRHETQVGRRLVLFTRVPDRPGALAGLLACVADAGANLVEVEHVREGVDLHVRETAVQLVLETRGREHAQQVLEAVAGDGYVARSLD